VAQAYFAAAAMYSTDALMSASLAAELAGSPRTALMAKNLARPGAEERAAIRRRGERLLADMDGR
jgi:hypothetical protein